MIRPVEYLPPLNERPRFNFPMYVRLCYALLGPVVRWWRMRVHRWSDAARQRRLRDLLSAAMRCDERQELETLLGKPKYALRGELFQECDPDGECRSPQRVEVYNCQGFSIEALFWADGTYSLCGST
ncbi:MAG: hypothetical protein WD229_02425 [Pirellulales bacterium]